MVNHHNIGPNGPKNLSIHGQGIFDVSGQDEKVEKKEKEKAPSTLPKEEHTQVKDGYTPGEKNIPAIERYIRKKDGRKSEAGLPDNNAAEPGDSVTVNIMHTNDLHGNLLPKKKADTLATWDDFREQEGGAAAMTTIIKDYRRKSIQDKSHFLLLDAGDMSMGTSISGKFKGEPVIEVMNRQGYDAATLGNHEFDWGMEPLKNMIQRANFPVLSANIRDRQGKPIADTKPYMIKDLGDVKVGVVGVITPETVHMNTREEVKSFHIEDPVETLKKTVPEMKKNGADMIVVLSHAGLKDDVRMAREAPGLDVIIGGHTHDALEVPLKVNGTIIAQTGSSGKKIGRIQLKWNKNRKKVISSNGCLIPVDPQEVKPDREISDVIAGYKAKIDEVMNVELGRLEEDLVSPDDGGETNLGNMLTDAMREKTGADVALLNSGSIRTNLIKGEVTYGDIYNVFPFESQLTSVEMPGSHLLQILDEAAGKERDARLQVSGMNITYNSSKPAGQRVIQARLDNGETISANKKYKVATIDYLLGGGDNFQSFKNVDSKKVEKYGSMQEQMANHVKGHKILSAPPLGRLEDINLDDL